MSKIENRNLIVVETFDEFAMATENMDFSVEDLVAYVTSLANVFYWLNVESVWGRLGFVWDHLENNQGYGHFVRTTIPFTVIPSLPDGERITAMYSDFVYSVNSTNIEVLKSNWENLEVIKDITGSSSKTLIMDLTGAPFTGMHDSLDYGRRVGRLFIMSDGTLYLKADFSQCGANDNIHYFHIIKSGGTFIIDDENKYLNMPSKSNYTGEYSTNEPPKGILYWKGEGPFRIDYIFRDFGPESDELTLVKIAPTNNYNSFQDLGFTSRPSSNYYVLKADSKEYIIPSTTTFDESYYYVHPFVVEINSSPTKVTVDCSKSGIVILTKIFQRLSDYSYKYMSALYPIEYTGTLEAIDAYNPYVYVKDTWPAFNASVVNKVMDTDFSALIYRPYFDGPLLKCPYTFDVSNRDYVRLNIANSKQYLSTLDSSIKDDCTRTYKGVGKYFKVDSQYKTVSDYTLNILTYSPCPNIIGNHKFKKFDIKCMGTYDYKYENYGYNFWGYSMQDSGQVGYSRSYYILVGWTLSLSTIEADNLTLEGAFITDGVKLKANYLFMAPYSESSAVKTIYMYKTVERPYYTIHYGLTTAFLNWTNIDFIEYEDLSDEVLNASYIDTSALYPNEGYSYLMPYIITKGSLTVNINSVEGTAMLNNRTFNPSLIFIKSGINIEFTFKGTCDYYSIANIKRLIHGIKKVGTNTSVGTITLISTIYDALVADDANFESYVINTLGYTLIRREYNDV